MSSNQACLVPSNGGDALWVGPPLEYPEEDTSDPTRTFLGASLQCEPFFQDWSAVGVVEVFGAEITPDTSGGGTITLADVTLVIGDINSDGTINITDLTTVAASFGTADPVADVNGDGTVNITDITTVANNFGLSAPTAW